MPNNEVDQSGEAVRLRQLEGIDTPQRKPSERRPYNPSRPAIHDTGYHPFKESEFAEGVGYCDHCGGGPDAEVHQKPIDQMERLATILEVSFHWSQEQARYERMRRMRGLWRRIVDWFLGER
jgi:hypothetical protein